MWVNDAVICSGGNLNGQTTVPPAVGGTLGSGVRREWRNESCAIQTGSDAVDCWGAT